MDKTKVAALIILNNLKQREEKRIWETEQLLRREMSAPYEPFGESGKIPNNFRNFVRMPEVMFVLLKYRLQRQNLFHKKNN